MNRIADSQSLSVFLAVAEAGSFAAAAARLGVSPAAVGQTVKRLEDRYGVRLFNRTTRKMSLTLSGWLLRDRCREPLRQLDEIEHMLQEQGGIVAGPIRVSAPLYVARTMLIPLLAAFRQDHPGVAFDIDMSDAVRDFVDDPIDLAIRLSQPEDSSLIARPLRAIEAVTVASPGYLKRRGVPAHPQDLDGHDCIAYRYPTSGAVYCWTFDVGGQSIDYPPPRSIVFNDPEATCIAAVEGMGILQTADLFVAPHLAEGALVEVMPRFRKRTRTLYLCYPSREMPLRIRIFADFLIKRLK